MSKGIIKDFKRWNLITEYSDPVSIYTGATVHTSSDGSTSDSGSSDSGDDLSNSDSSDSDSKSSDRLDKDIMLSGAKDGELTTDDIKKIQAVIFGVYLTDTETCDGNVGPITKTKIKEFRTIHEITGDDDIEPDKKTVGPLTLAKISEIIKAG